MKKEELFETIAKMSNSQIMAEYKINQQGYMDSQVESQRKRYGVNQLDYGQVRTIWHELYDAFITPFTLVLLVLAVISWVTEYLLAPEGHKDPWTVVIILVLVVLSGSMTFIQTYRSNRVADKLQEMVKVTTNVLRNGEFKEIPLEEVVVGDQVRIAVGDMIPADLRLIQVKDLFVSQSALTGESYPIEKYAKAVDCKDVSVTDYNNLAFMGSNVVSGSGLGVVVTVGNDTLLGDVAQQVSTGSDISQFEAGLADTSKLLIQFMIVMAPLVLIINGITTRDWIDSLLFALSVAVGLTPEMLPMVVTTNLVKGANTMAQEATIIKNMASIQNFGAIDVLCTDKTGTLTQDEIVLETHLDLNGHTSERVLRHAYLNAYYQTGFKNLLDKAIIKASQEALNTSQFSYTKVDEVPFDFQRRRMSVVVADPQGKTQMITKGAIEEMVSVSAFADIDGEIVPLTEKVKTQLLDRANQLNKKGMRVLGVAQKTNPAPVDQFSIKDESDMVLIGYLAFLDPPKESTKSAIEALYIHNVNVKILTGDNLYVTQAVCRQVGMDASQYIDGQVYAQLDEAGKNQAVKNCQIFVKLVPAQKADIVRRLQQVGHTVGFMGDGINDAPALQVADVGISVDNAVDIAKESADIILLQKDLMILERGILSGRQVFGNIMKYIKATTSSNFGNIFSVLIASILLPFIPMLPVQLLLLNLIYDITCMAIPFDWMDSDYLVEPKKWDATSIKQFMLIFGPTSSIFDVIMFIVLLFVLIPGVLGGYYGDLSVVEQIQFEEIFHSGWFVLSLWTQTFVLYALRTEKLPFIESTPSFPVMVVTILGILIGSILPFTVLGQEINLAPLPSIYWPWLIGLVATYLALVTIVKHLYLRKHDNLL